MKLTASASGAGKVYVSNATIGTSTSGLTNSKTLSGTKTTSSGSAPTSADVTFYVKAVPDSDDYGFAGWSGSGLKDSKSAETTVTISSSSDSESNPVAGTVTATFKPYHEYRACVRCQIIGGGKVAIGDGAYSDSEIVSPEQKCEKTLDANASFNFAVHAQATDGWSFVRWKDANGKELSTTLDYTHKVTSAKYGDDIEEVTIIAEFAQSHTYYAKTDVYVDETCPNGGLVAVARTNSSSGLTYGSEATLTDNQTLADNSATFTYYAFAKCADDWWNFGGWYEDGQLVSREPNFSFDSSTSSEDEANPAGRSLAAKFVQAPLVTATCKQSEGGSYTVSGTCDTAPTVEKVISAGTASESVGLPRSLSITLSAAVPEEGYKFRHWWKIADDGTKVALSEGASVSIDVPEDGLTVGADFIPAGLNYAAGDTCFETIADAVAAGQTAVSLIGNYEVVENVTVPTGAELIVPEGATLTVDAGVTLTIDGTLWVSGTVVNNGDIGGAGAVSVMNKQFKQTGKDGMNGAAAEPFFPFTAPSDGKTYRPSPFGLKYWDTKSTTAMGSVTGNAVACTSQTHMTLLNGKGQEVHYVYSETLPAFIKCNLDTSVAINHITNFTATTYSGLQDAYNGGEFCLYTGTSDATADFGSKTTIAKTFTVDGVHKSMTISCSQQNGAVVLTFINCNTASITKINNSTARFVNCTSAKSGKINNNAATYSPYVFAYDCGDLSFSWESTKTLAPDGMAPAGVYVFSGGKYTFSYSYMNCHLFGGTFKNEPKPDTNCTIGPGLKVSSITGGGYVVEPSEGEVSIKLTVDGKTVKKSSLEEAIKDAGTSQATIALSDDLELAAPVTIGADQNIILQLAQHKIAAKNGAIVNNGNLTVDCWSSEQGSMTTESGTLIKNCAGELHLVYGSYVGEISVEGGVLYTHAGIFDTALTVAGAISDPTTAVKIRGGQFKGLTYSYGGVTKELVGLCPEGYHAMDAGAGRSYLLPDVPVTITENTSGKVGSYSCEAVYDFEFLTSAERAIYKKGNARSEQNSLQDWFRKAELYATVDPQTSGFGPDGVVSFDRDVAADAIKAYGEITTPLGIRAAKGGGLPRGLAARGQNEPLPNNTMAKDNENNIYLPDPRYYYVIYENGAFQSFSVFMNDLSGDGTVGLGRANPDDLSIIGTTCRIDLMLCRRASRYTQQEQLKEYKVLASRFHKFTGKGAIYGSTDYDSLAAALSAASYSGTVRLSKDCSEQITIGQECSFTLDKNNFEFTGTIAAGAGFIVKKNGEVYSVVKAAEEIAEVEVAPAQGESQGVTVSVKVEDAWVKDVEAKGETVDQAIQKTEKNGLKVWENKLVEQAEAKGDVGHGFAAVRKTETVVAGKTVVVTVVTENKSKESSEYDITQLETGTYQPTKIVKDASENEVAVPDVDKPAVNVVRNESTDQTVVLAIPGNTTVKGAVKTPNAGDEIRVYDVGEGGYLCWTYDGTNWSPKNSLINGKLVEPMAAESQQLASGMAVVYVKSDASKVVTVAAEGNGVLMTELPETTKETDEAKGKWNLVANPTADDFDLNKIDGSQDAGHAVAATDRIVVLAEKGLGRVDFKKKSETGKWGRWKTTEYQDAKGKWRTKTEWVEEAMLKKGQAMWYISNGGNPQIKWSVK